MRIAPLGLRDGDREKLVALTRASWGPAGLAQQARIVLLPLTGCRTPKSRRGWRFAADGDRMAGTL